MDQDDRRAVGLLLELENLLVALYKAARQQSPRPRWRIKWQKPAVDRKAVDKQIIAAFLDEAFSSVSAHVQFLRSHLKEMGEVEATSPIDIESGLLSTLRAASVEESIFQSDHLYRYLLCAYIIEDVLMTATHRALDRTNDRWLREYLPGLLVGQTCRSALVRAFLFAANLSDVTWAIAVHRQKACDLQGTAFQANDHGVGDLATPTMMPTAPRHLGWGRTVDQCALIVSGSGQGAPGAFFPAGISLLKIGMIDSDDWLPEYYETIRLSVEVVAAYTAESVDLPPMQLPSDDMSIAENTPYQPWTQSRYESCAPSAIRLRNALVHGCVGITGFDGRMIKESLWHTEPSRHRYCIHDDRVALFGRGREYLHGQTVSILTGAAESYWHSLLDSIARLFIIPADAWPTIDRILYPATGVRIDELLRLLPIPDSVEKRMVHSHETFEVDHLIYPSSIHVMFDYHPSILRTNFAAMVRRATDGRESPSPRFLYIDRRGALLRSLLNEDELIACLPDFIPVKLETMSIVEQVRLFAGAEIIIAPHGAGLTNIVFARKGCIIVEMMMDRYCNWCYRRLAAIMGQSYLCVMGRAARQDSSVQFTPWTVDTTHLLRALETARSQISQTKAAV